MIEHLFTVRSLWASVLASRNRAKTFPMLHVPLGQRLRVKVRGAFHNLHQEI
jgi:hypothetical protein